MKKKLILWLVWLLLLPFVFLFYLGSDLVKLRWPPTCLFKIKLVYQSIYERFILGKS